MFVSKCYVVLLANISGIRNESFVELTFNYTRFGDVESAPMLVGCW